MKSNGTTNDIPCPSITGSIPRLSAAGSIDVTNARSISFDADADGLQLNYGSSADASNFWTLSAGDSFAFGDTVAAIYVNGACGYTLS